MRTSTGFYINMNIFKDSLDHLCKKLREINWPENLYDISVDANQTEGHVISHSENIK